MDYLDNSLLDVPEYFYFPSIKRYLEQNNKNLYPGKCYPDISAFCTPFRCEYFKDVAKQPADYLLFGSDFPTPVFEIYADMKEKKCDLIAILEGHLERAIVLQDNLLDVNYQQLRKAFPGHPLFKNFSMLIESYST